MSVNNLHSRGLLMCVQVGTYSPYMLQDFFLLWDAQQCSPLPEFPDVKPQEVKPFCDMHYPGFGFTECQSSFLEKFFQSWSDVGFQYFPCWGRCHKVIGVASDRYPFIDSLAKGWGFGSSIGVFCVEQPFHPIQCHICQQWRTYTPYKVANLVLEFSTSIPRTQLHPGYGDGFLGAPLHGGLSREAPTPQAQGDQRGTSSQHIAPDSGGFSHI